MIKFDSQRLPNGMQLITAPMHETQAVTVLFLFKVGSRYETKSENGLSHFLEHMFFKGTEKRPTTLDISQELDSLGADYNAYTGEERTGYYISCAANEFPTALDVLADMLYGSKFEEAEINREKGVIVEEIKMYRDSPMSYLAEVAKQVAFGDSSLGRDIAGTPESVNRFSRADFLRHRDSHYNPQNTIVVVAGNPDNHNWAELLTKTLADRPAGAGQKFETQTINGNDPTVLIGTKPVDQAHICLMHYGLNHTDPKLETLEVLSNILGGTMSSRLFVEVRERRGLAYYANSSLDTFHDIGLFEANAGVDPKKLDEALSVIVQEINNLKTEPVSAAELKRAKQNITGRMSLRLEDSHSIARYLANDLLELGAIEQPEAYLKKVDAVNEQAILDLANQLFKPEMRRLAVVGPLEAKDQDRLKQIISQ